MTPRSRSFKPNLTLNSISRLDSLSTRSQRNSKSPKLFPPPPPPCSEARNRNLIAALFISSLSSFHFFRYQQLCLRCIIPLGYRPSSAGARSLLRCCISFFCFGPPCVFFSRLANPQFPVSSSLTLVNGTFSTPTQT